MSRTKPAIKIRDAKRQDIPELVELDRAAYPVLASGRIVWGESHLRHRLRVFPEARSWARHHPS